MTKQGLLNPKGNHTVKIAGGDRYYVTKERAEGIKELLLDVENRPEFIRISGDVIKTDRILEVIDCSNDQELINEL